MKLFALADPHLSFDENGEEYKSMGIFSNRWLNHGEKIRQNWLKKVTAEDVVLLPGDISWAMTLEAFQPDLAFLAALPGKKIISKGNHDLWLDSLRKIKKILPAGVSILQNNSYVFGNVAICGTRGWICPEGQFQDEHDTKIFKRELIRLKLSLDTVPPNVGEKIVVLHYPPVNGKHEKSAFVELMEQYGVSRCLYGHLHSFAWRNALQGEHWGIQFQLVSADYLGFAPKFICQI